VRVFLSTGEVSGDIVGAHLARAITARDATAELVGVGGARMAAAGVVVDVPTNHLGTVGVSEAFAALPSLVRVLRAISDRIRHARPDVAVLIGNDVFNVLLARWLRGRGIPTLSYFPPQVWIWRAVAPFIARSFDEILTSFPEEHEVYSRAAASAGSSATFVGHYLADAITSRTETDVRASRRELGLGDGRVVALLPGSRVHEVRALGRLLLGAAAILTRGDSGLQLVLPLAEPSFRADIERQAARLGLVGRLLVCADSHTAMRAADVTVLASGTASLEAALLGVPTVIVYTVSALTLAVIRTVIKMGLVGSETVGLPNLILARPVVAELRQKQVTPEAVAAEAEALLGDAERRRAMVEAFARVRTLVAVPGTMDRAAAAVLKLARRARGEACVGNSCSSGDELEHALKGRC
jgi:lipid-A-disaccharide synthase